MCGMYNLLLLSIIAIQGLITPVRSVADSLEKQTISAPGISATFIAYGARLTNLLVKDRHGNYQDVALGYDKSAKYVNDSNHEHTYFGAVSTFFHLLLGCREYREYLTDFGQLADMPIASGMAPST